MVAARERSEFDKLSEDAQEFRSRLEEESEKIKLSQSEKDDLCNQLCCELSALQSALSAANQRAARCETMVKHRKSEVKETAQEVLQQQLSTEEMAFKSQVTEMIEKNKSLSTRAVQAETRGTEMQEQLRAVRDECNQRMEASHNLDQLLSSMREDLEHKGRDLELARRDKEAISRRLSECVAEGERLSVLLRERDSRLFSVMLRKLWNILKYEKERINNIDTDTIQKVNELIDELGMKWDFEEKPILSRTDMVFQTMEYWNNNTSLLIIAMM